ncbi:flagellar basal-body rod protein FlgF [Enterovirga aerilata]|uniref:Flagellar basal-body rod protein FlgF n=1 Tax=Enterovirga aerilata TaxID=2730920 RepID=A0A849I1Z5_9HYPH|nr:flagellar basal-body rod protein FlgF [Enterovirga sp. DB1703]NNM71634.1 flagellar basal-body rod protein FlgF [Enterovirga sp. DB1703]
MENALLVGLSRQMALRRELDVIANNVANVSTNGFKARASRFESYLMPKASGDAFRRPDRRLDYVIDKGTALDTSAGAIEYTRNPLDVAIKGDGFFAVQTAGGERYTRNGAFMLDAQGQLVTSDGHLVLGDNGPIAFDRNETDISIAPDGTVSSAQAQHGHVRVVRFADMRTLRNEGGNLFSATAPAEPAGATSRLESGALERSNVKAVQEMTRLIEVNRAYASVASMVGRLEDLKRTAISKLADGTNAA